MRGDGRFPNLNICTELSQSKAHVIYALSLVKNKLVTLKKSIHFMKKHMILSSRSRQSMNINNVRNGSSTNV
eukprot:7459884-Ditylum_brightwellii.AAC.1